MPKRRRSKRPERPSLDNIHHNTPRLVVRAQRDVKFPKDPVLTERQAQAKERLELDRLRYRQLRRAGFTGPAWDAFTDDLWVYALPVLKGLLRTGQIFDLCWQHGMVVRPTADERRSLHTSSDDRDELAIESIAKAMVAFRKRILRTGHWTPKKKATLRTFFVGACILQFGGVFRRWQRERTDRLAGFGYGVDVELVAGELASGLSSDPELYMQNAELLTTLLRRASPEVRMACFLVLQGHTYAEIADQLGVSERVIEGQLHRLRKRVRTMVKRGQVEVPGFLKVEA